MKSYGCFFLGAVFLAQLPEAAAAGPLEPQNQSTQPADQAASPSSTESRVVELEEVTVQGRRPLIDGTNVTLGAFGNRDAMEIPLTIQSFSSALLENTRARTLLDVTAYDPSVQDDRINSDYSNLGIRGFQSDWWNTIRRDGLNLAPYQDVPLEGVDQVTVLKGPSGFLYGFNSPGGTVNFITKRPTLEPFTEVTVEGRSYHGLYAHVDTSGTLGASRDLGYRVNFGHEHVGDLTHSGDLRRTFVTGALDWRVNDKAIVQLNADYQRKEIAAQPVIGVSNGRLPPLFDPRTLLGQPWLQYKTDAYNVYGRLDYELSSNWTLTAHMTYSSNVRYTGFPGISAVDANGNILSKGSNIRISPDQSFKVGSGEVFVRGNFSTFGIEQELVTGASWESYKALQAGYISLPITVGNIFSPVYSPEPTLPPNPAKTHDDTLQSSAFASDVVTLSQSWHALLGVRYIHFSDNLSVPFGTATLYIRNKLVPNVGVTYMPTSNIMAYVDYTQGLQQSATAPATSNNPNAALAPLLSTQYEAGVKARLGKNVSGNFAIFQITKTLQYLNADNFFVESGRQRHRGVELSANGQITNNFTLVAGMSRLFTTQMNTGQVTVNGKRTPNAPKWQGTASLEYQLHNVKGLFVNGAVRYIGDRAADAANTVIAPGFTTFDLGARYVCVLFNQNVIFRGSVKNVADRRYWAGADPVGVFPGESRTAYLSATVDF